MAEALALVGRSVLAVSLAAAVAWPCHVLAWRLVPTAGPALRGCAMAVIAAWMLAASFWVLLPLGLFSWAPAVTTWVAIAIAIDRMGNRRGRAWRRLQCDLAHLHRTWQVLTLPTKLALAAVGTIAAIRTLRGLVAPPLGWDALTYHLLKAGRWVQHGTQVLETAPDAWSYYAYFPPTGDLYWAWTMLPLHRDDLLTAAGASIWLVGAWGIHAAARQLGAERNQAVLAATTVAAMPSALAYLSSAYVDNTLLGLFTCGTALLLHARRTRRIGVLVAVAAAFALAVGIKPTAVPMAAIAAMILLGLLLGRRDIATGHRIQVLLASTVAVLPALPGYLRAWIEQGSPLYPFGLTVAGRQIFAGNQSLARLASGDSPVAAITAEQFWAYILYRPAFWDGSFVNPGPALLLLIALALGGTAIAWRKRRWVGGGFLLATIAVMLAGLASSNMELFRTTLKVTSSGRYFLPMLAALAMLAALVPGRAVQWLWLLATCTGAAFSLPRAWALAEVEGMGWLLALSAIVVAIGAWADKALRGRVFTLVCCVLWIGWVVGLTQIRDRHRHAIYRAAAVRPPVYHMHALDPRSVAAAVLWRHLDDGHAHTLATTAGWDGLGHNWYRYPLLGHALQNHVQYVPVTTDGEIIDYRNRRRVAQAADLRAWLQRLLDRDIDHVVSLAPQTTIESFWMVRLPELFVPVAADAEGWNVAFRIDHGAVRRFLARPAPSVHR